MSLLRDERRELKKRLSELEVEAQSGGLVEVIWFRLLLLVCGVVLFFCFFAMS